MRLANAVVEPLNARSLRPMRLALLVERPSQEAMTGAGGQVSKALNRFLGFSPFSLSDASSTAPPPIKLILPVGTLQVRSEL